MEAKYIMLTNGLGPIAEMFSANASHAEMIVHRKGVRLMSAGKFRLSVVDGKIDVACWGGSDSLHAAGFPPINCVSRPEKDAAILRAVFAQ